jgi:hypothetical protein
MRFMRVLTVCAACSSPIQAQMLEVGGFDIRLASSFDSTARRLSAVYELQSLSVVSAVSGGKMWWIRRRDADRTILGSLWEKDGFVVGIDRKWTGGSDQIATAFVSFWTEARRLGGSECVTTPEFVIANGGPDATHITSYSTKCGLYRVVHGLAWPAMRVGESLTLSLTMTWLFQR